MKKTGYYADQARFENHKMINEIKTFKYDAWDYYDKLILLRDCYENDQMMNGGKNSKYIINHSNNKNFRC